MGAILRWAAAIGAALLFLTMGAGPAQAQYFCSSDARCGSSSHCVNWLGPIKRCEFFRCNADSNCPTDRACLLGLCTRTVCNATADCPRGTCIGGICRRPAATSGGGGGGSSGGGQGARCGKANENGVPRVYPACAASYRCVENRCTRPEQ